METALTPQALEYQAKLMAFMAHNNMPPSTPVAEIMHQYYLSQIAMMDKIDAQFEAMSPQEKDAYFCRA